MFVNGLHKIIFQCNAVLVITAANLHYQNVRLPTNPKSHKKPTWAVTISDFHYQIIMAKRKFTITI